MNRFLLLAVVLPYVLLRAYFLDFIPVFDGQSFIDCLYQVTTRDFNPLTFVCHKGWNEAIRYGHYSLIYFGLGLLQHFSLESFWPSHLGTTFLHLLAAVSFLQVLEHCFAQWKIEISEGKKAALLALFVYQPVMVANSINLSLDQPMSAFYLYFLASLLTRRHWHLALSTFLLVSTKETGIAMGGITLGVYALTQLNWRESPRLAVSLILGALPYIGLALTRWLVSGESVLHMAEINASRGKLLSLEMWNYNVLNYLLELLVLNFNWVITLGAAAGMLRWKLWRTPESFCLGILAIGFFVLSRYAPPTNVRYLIPLFPFMLVLFARAAAHRQWVVGVALVATLLANVASVDPISRAIWGTFRFGRHQMYQMTSITTERVDKGRDQAIYNLESTQFHYAVDQALAAEKPEVVITGFPFSAWDDFGAVHISTFHRTYGRKQSRIPRVLDAEATEWQNPPPGKVVFLALPYLNRYQEAIDVLLKKYEIISRKEYGRGGYTVEAIAFRRKVPTPTLLSRF